MVQPSQLPGTVTIAALPSGGFIFLAVLVALWRGFVTAAKHQLGVEEGQLLGVPLEVAQVDHQVGLLLLDGLDHAAGVAVGVGKHKNFQKSHLTSSGAYTGMKSSWKGDPV